MSFTSIKPDQQMAFPSEGGVTPYYRAGMTLRDYFAAKAMQAYCGQPSWTRDVNQSETAECAYVMADAMLEARNG